MLWEWIIAACLTAIVIDLDVVALVFIESSRHQKLIRYRNPINVFKDYNRFMNIITQTGVLKKAMKTHLILSAILLLSTNLIAPTYQTPVVLGIISHLASDIPNVIRTRSHTESTS